MLRFDYIFSIWIFIWYILYELYFISYNPKIWIIIALILNFINFLFMLYFKRFYIAILFLIPVLFLKIIPLWTLRNTKIYMKDFIFGIFLFIIHNIWLMYNSINYYTIFKNYLNMIKYNEINTPIIKLLDNTIKKYIKK
jgi:hypothetical protein